MHKHFIKTSSGQMIDPGKVDSLGWVGETGIRINVGGEIVTDHWPTIGERRLWAVELDYAQRGLDFIRADWTIAEGTPERVRSGPLTAVEARDAMQESRDDLAESRTELRAAIIKHLANDTITELCHDDDLIQALEGAA